VCGSWRRRRRRRRRRNFLDKTREDKRFYTE
jgi:hypothetical protein